MFPNSFGGGGSNAVFSAFAGNLQLCPPAQQRRGRGPAATATMIPTSTITGRMPSTPLPSPPPPSSPARASAPSPAAPRETLLPVSQDVKILRCGASRSLAFAIPATPGAVTSAGRNNGSPV